VRCAIYARYSSDNQRKSSIEDQVRNCREIAERKGWVVLESAIYTDIEKSGTTLYGRDALQAAVAAAKLKPRPFEYILIDDSLRLGRNKADDFKTVEILKFHGVHLYFCEDMLDSAESWFEQAFHFKAQIDQEYSRSLGQKVKRGRRGRYLAGFNPGGACYGYKNIPVEDFTRKGEYGRPAVIGVNQVIDPEEAAVVVRMFEADLHDVQSGERSRLHSEREPAPIQAGARLQSR
jgi:site-specific DNA recombinase